MLPRETMAGVARGGFGNKPSAIDNQPRILLEYHPLIAKMKIAQNKPVPKVSEVLRNQIPAQEDSLKIMDIVKLIKHH